MFRLQVVGKEIEVGSTTRIGKLSIAPWFFLTAC
jgi:hypothetical protein